MTTRPTHLDESGAVHMVDVGAKPATERRAVAGGRITMTADALEAIRSGNASKGDVLSTARIAGIMAAKRTADLIPLCHPLARSEEHTSELQSLMRISYAVSSLKKKTTTHIQYHPTSTHYHR